MIKPEKLMIGKAFLFIKMMIKPSELMIKMVIKIKLMIKLHFYSLK